jgi:hypothetical protein
VNGAPIALVKEIAMRRLIATTLLLMLAACGSGTGVGSVTGPSGERERGPEPSAESVTGTWSGGNDRVQLVWFLTQDGDSVSGTTQVTGSDGWTGRGGYLVGKINGSRFSFSDSHPVGTLTIGGCSAQLEGTLQLTRVLAPVGPPRPYYPGGPPIAPPPMTTKSTLSGQLKGEACGHPLSGNVTIVKN